VTAVTTSGVVVVTTQDDKTKPSSSSNNDTTTTATATFHFPKLNQQIQQAIVDLGGGGGVVPKLNWSSPRDAVWINGYSLQCRTVGDVYLLLKSSDFVLHDVLYAFDDVAEVDDNHDDAPELELVLRKWCNLHPSMEFRCFVWQKQLSKFNQDRLDSTRLDSSSSLLLLLLLYRLSHHHHYVISLSIHILLVAISQRHDTQQFDHLASVPSSAQDDIQQLIHTFFHEIVQTNFSLNNYCLDVYVDKQQRVWVLDFNVWHTRTDALLFTWKELMELATNTNTNQQQSCEEGESTTTTTTSTTTTTCCCCKIVFRVVQESQVQQDPLASYRAPTDMTTTIPYLTNHFEEFMNMCQKPSEYHDNDTTSSSSSSDNDVKEEGKDELE
jgi:hypothetical protein